MLCVSFQINDDLFPGGHLQIYNLSWLYDIQDQMSTHLYQNHHHAKLFLSHHHIHHLLHNLPHLCYCLRIYDHLYGGDDHRHYHLHHHYHNFLGLYQTSILVIS